MYQFYFVGNRDKNGRFPIDRDHDVLPFDESEQEGVLEYLCDSAFDSTVFHVLVEDRWIQESRASVGKVRIQCDHAPCGELDFETEDIRGQIVLPLDVTEEQVQYVIFFNGDQDEEDGVLQWAVIIED